MVQNYNYNIAVILPSRGLAFSQTMEEILNNLYGYKWTIYFSHGLPIPDCFNKPLEKALQNGIELFKTIKSAKEHVLAKPQADGGSKDGGDE